MTTRCPICTGAMASTAALCPACGHVPAVTCPSCGAQRLRTQRSCPACGRGWVTDAGDEAPVLVAAGQAASATGRDASYDTMPSVYRQLMEDEGAPPLWNPEDEATIGAIHREPSVDIDRGTRLASAAAGLVVAVIALVGIVKIFSSDEAAAPTTTLVPVTTTLPAVALPPTPSDTVVPATTTTTTLPPAPAIPAVEPIGEPIPLDQLTMSIDGLGVLTFGADFPSVVGRLAAGLDQPQQIDGPGVSSGEYGTCPGETIRTARFGRLLVIGADSGGGEVFVGYRTSVNYDAAEYPGIQTLSGLQTGDTVATLQTIYQNLDVRFANDPVEGLVFQLWRPADGLLLLWGPITSTQADGIVEGIYSPLNCLGA